MGKVGQGQGHVEVDTIKNVFMFHWLDYQGVDFSIYSVILSIKVWTSVFTLTYLQCDIVNFSCS